MGLRSSTRAIMEPKNPLREISRKNCGQKWLMELKLSGGQKQRIAVARALIRNKPILILDEGTSAIDMQTAYDIENRLLKKEDLTLITITHHLEQNLLDKYDEIFYMENGRIKERGSFKHLINTSSCFSGYFHYNQKVSGSS